MNTNAKLFHRSLPPFLTSAVLNAFVFYKTNLVDSYIMDAHVP